MAKEDEKGQLVIAGLFGKWTLKWLVCACRVVYRMRIWCFSLHIVNLDNCYVQDLVK